MIENTNKYNQELGKEKELPIYAVIIVSVLHLVGAFYIMQTLFGRLQEEPYIQIRNQVMIACLILIFISLISCFLSWYFCKRLNNKNDNELNYYKDYYLKRNNELQKDNETILQQLERSKEIENINILNTQLIVSYEQQLQYKNLELQKLCNEIKKSFELLKQARERALEGDRLKSMFLALMSHEVRTPLNGIEGFSQMLLRPNIPNQKKELYKDHLIDSTKRLLNTINSIEFYAKIQSGDIKPIYEDFDVNFMLYNLFLKEKLNLKEQSKNDVEIIFDVDFSSRNFINTCQKSLQNILERLLANAIKFTNFGSITLAYTINKDNIVFEIKDSGIGIEDDKKDCIFDSFIQSDDSLSRKYDGVGLGLSIVKSLVLMLGGNISVQSRINQGSCFTFSIPINQSNKQEIDLYKQIEQQINVVAPLGNILLLSQGNHDFEYYKDVLNSYKLKFLTANNLQDALTLVQVPLNMIFLLVVQINQDIKEILQTLDKMLLTIPKLYFVFVVEQIDENIKNILSKYSTQIIDKNTSTSQFVNSIINSVILKGIVENKLD